MPKPTKEEQYKIAHNIRKMRGIRGFDQNHMADQLGINQNTYSRIETGESTPDDERLEKIAETLNTTVDAIKGTDVEKIVFHIQHQEGHSGNVSVYSAVGKEIGKAIDHAIKPLKKEMRQLKLERAKEQQSYQALKEEILQMKEVINAVQKLMENK